MKYIVSIFSFLLSITGYSQIVAKTEIVTRTSTVVELASEFFPNEKRLIKISLPKGYDKAEKYPVIYALDGYSLFEMVTNYTQILGKQTIEADGYDYGTNVIPPAIVVGIFHNDRNLETETNFNGLDYL